MARREKTVAELLREQNRNRNGRVDPGAFCGDAYEGQPHGQTEYAGDHAIDLAEPSWEPPRRPTLPKEALHGLAGDIVRTIEPSTEADSSALLVQTLVSFGSIVGRTANFRAEDDAHYLNEFAVLIGKTSKARKGSSWGRVRRVVEAADPDWTRERVVSGLSSGEGLIESVRDALHDKQGEVVSAAVDDKRLLVYEAEFAGVLRQVERHGNTLSVILRHAWDGHRLRTPTRNSPQCATGAHVSLIGHVTMAELTKLLSSTEVANGFANRILWLYVERSKELPDGAPLDEAKLQPLQQRFREATDFAKDVGTMRRDHDARELWHRVYGPLSEGKPGLAGSLLARAEAHVMRLACIYALTDHACLVRVEHLQAALALWDYVEQSVRYVWGTSLDNPVADEILCTLRNTPDGLSRTQISGLFGRNRTAEQIGRALALLGEHGLARSEPRATGGRPVDVWLASGQGQGRGTN